MILTEQERDCLRLLGEVGVLVKEITFTKGYPFDWREAASALHVLQNMVMSQAAARAYPEDYRLLGVSLNSSTTQDGGRSDQTSKEE